MSSVLKCGKLVLPDNILSNAFLHINEGKISAITLTSQVRDYIDYSDKIVGPGLIDMHCHGALNADFADGDKEGMRKAALYHLHQGTTTLLATVGSCSSHEMIQAMQTAQALSSTIPNIYGIHLEGPYFNKGMYGCHLFEHIRNPERAEWLMYEPYTDILKMVTLAPELPGVDEFLEFYKDKGIIFSAGHSLASYNQMQNALKNAVTHSCHLFCAQPRASRVNYVLEPGVFESVLMLEGMTTEIICDGIHVGPLLVEWACRIKGTDTIAFVSDALRGVGCPPGDYAFGPKNGHICTILPEPKVGVVPGKEHILASSAVVLADGIRIFSQKTSIPLEHIWKMSSTVPAKILNIGDKKGALEIGFDADILILNNDLTVHEVYTQGKQVGTLTV